MLQSQASWEMMKMTAKITINGKEYEIAPVSDVLINLVKEAVKREFIERGEPINPPTYEIETAGGGKSIEAHDETTLSTDDDRKAWAAHIEAVQRLTIEVNNRTNKAWLSGIVFDIPEDENWKAHQKFLGVRIPDDPEEMRWHYLTTEILKSTDDYMTALSQIMKESYRGVVKEDDIDAAIGSFRNQLQGQVTNGFAARQVTLGNQKSKISRTKHR
jgi:hypothetical protein